jgi:16S rRNA (cytidine1402-2'-O)-methyltransferase
MQGKLYLIPTLLDENETIEDFIPAKTIEIIRDLDCFIVENEKSARKFLKKAEVKIPQSELLILNMGKHSDKNELKQMVDQIKKGRSVGVLSEAGCPGIADPGAEVVTIAHQNNIEVVPLIGPSSILLSLMASGFNGQSFSFYGYLPIDKNNRAKKIAELEKISERFDQTQIFIETPFRNNPLMDDILRICNAQTRLSVSCDLTSPSQFIQTKTIAEWKKEKPDLHKRPAIFLLYSSLRSEGGGQTR